MQQPHHSVDSPCSQSAADVLAGLQSDASQGLSDADAAERLTRLGPNQLSEPPQPALWQKLLGQFQDLMIGILIAAALVSGAIGEWMDALAIIAIVVLNAAIGFFQEERAERALAALQKMSSPSAKVMRSGKWQAIPASNLTCGDILELEAGNYVPADVRLIRTFDFSVQEAALTGESVPVTKEADIDLPAETSLADRRNLAYLGTIAAAGKATAVVFATGMQTELGRIAGLLQTSRRDPTPLQRQLAGLGRVLMGICLVIVAVIFALQLIRGDKLIDAFLLAVSLAVAAVPEGLPAVVTITLALGVQRMVRRHALVRKLPSVETLGSVTVICSDKTGTLTRNEMTVRELVVGEKRYTVSGSGYLPEGQFFDKDGDPRCATPIDLATRPDLVQALTAGAWCNNAQLVAPSDGNSWQVTGDPTEGALLVVAQKANVQATGRSDALLHEIPFDSNRKAMSVIVEPPGQERWMYTKGAPEVILGKCLAEQVDAGERPLSPERRAAWLESSAEMASRALRVLALAYRSLPGDSTSSAEETDLVLAGLVGMIDPPREEVKLAVQKCRDAGIRPVMITGDHPETALAVGRELHLAADGERAVTGQQLEQWSDEQLGAEVEQIAVYARASAEHKLRIVKAWQKRGEVVAMTGDGVNDAPSLKAADIGIAMGITGTDVTKEAADMVLTDDNFASIVNAVEEGRGIFDNIQKVLQYLLSCNLGEILLMLVASLLGWPAPLLPIQLLWINLVTDGLPALALALEPPEPGLMRRRPRAPKRPILSQSLSWTILLQGVLVGLVGLTAFAICYLRNPQDIAGARATAFCVIVYDELFRSLAARSRRYTCSQLGWLTNPALLLAVAVSGLLQLGVVTLPFAQPLFEIPPQIHEFWLLVALLALMPVTLIELAKRVRFRKTPGELRMLS